MSNRELDITDGANPVLDGNPLGDVGWSLRIVRGRTQPDGPVREIDELTVAGQRLYDVRVVSQHHVVAIVPRHYPTLEST